MPNNFKITQTPEGIKFNIRVLPNASKCEIVGIMEDSIKIKLDVPPVEGKANEKCIKFLSKLMGVPKTTISIISGDKSKTKIIFIKGEPDKLAIKFSEKVYNIINL